MSFQRSTNAGICFVSRCRVTDHRAWVYLVGGGPSTYVFTKTNIQRNLFRIPLQ